MNSASLCHSFASRKMSPLISFLHKLVVLFTGDKYCTSRGNISMCSTYSVSAGAERKTI